MTVTIDPEFENLLPPHTEAELKQLEANCQADPHHEQMPPILLWANGQNIIVDGHNQHRIRTKLGLGIRYAELTFADRAEALQHELKVQFGRRNLDASQRAIAYAKLPRLAAGRPGENVANLQCLDDLAGAAGVSKRTMSDAVKVAENGAAAVVKGVAAGKFSASDAASIVGLPEDEQKRAAEEAKQRKTTLRAAARIRRGSRPRRRPTQKTADYCASEIRDLSECWWVASHPTERGRPIEFLRSMAAELETRLELNPRESAEETMTAANQ